MHVFPVNQTSGSTSSHIHTTPISSNLHCTVILCIFFLLILILIMSCEFFHHITSPDSFIRRTLQHPTCSFHFLSHTLIFVKFTKITIFKFIKAFITFCCTIFAEWSQCCYGIKHQIHKQPTLQSSIYYTSLEPFLMSRGDGKKITEFEETGTNFFQCWGPTAHKKSWRTSILKT